MPAFTTVGLPDSAVRESRERVRTAIRNAGFAFPSDRITVNLAPADLRKEGASFDLAIALGILEATGAIKSGWTRPVCGRRRARPSTARFSRVRGALAVGLACRRRGIGTLVVPLANHVEALAVDGLRVLAAFTLGEAVSLLNGGDPALGPAGHTRDPAPVWTISISRTSEARRTPSARSRSRRPARITCCSWVLREGARRCWRGGSRPSCPR